ncbi:MAG TPA: pyridoxine 5'-phosphate synthase [Polyangia bacterium]|nr:pyridoxine 5'-phosphate synthase [Polyangia bacterium]
MTKLSVNVNKIATLRNTRANGIPDLSRLAALALASGANGITVHPRPDERHIRASDVPAMAAVVAQYPGAEFNIEGNPFHGLVEHCVRSRPTQATLVPDAREALTSNHGWNLAEMTPEQSKALSTSIARLRDLGCRVSLFVDPIPELIPLASALGADRVELYTEPYAARAADGRTTEAVAPYVAAAAAALDHGLGVNAGHDLNLDNLAAFLRDVRPVDEVSIGHALIADALELGLAEAVRRYLAICAASPV